MPPNNKVFCLALHDVSPLTWPQCKHILSMLDALGPFRVTLLVIPNHHGKANIDRDPNFLKAIDRRLELGDEIALHGYYHLDQGPPPRTWSERLTRFHYTAGEGEFSSLDRATSEKLIESGLHQFTRKNWPVRGFVAPAWLMSEGTWQTLHSFPLSYTSTLTGLYRLSDNTCLSARSLVYSVRSGWRRGLSYHWNNLISYRLRHEPLIRFGFHPADARYANVMDHWRALVQRAILQDRTAVTKHEALKLCLGSAA